MIRKNSRGYESSLLSADQKNACNIRQDNDVLIFPVSNTQRHFWLINQLLPESPAYNIPSVFRLKGRLNLPALEKGINGIIHRHEVFRTTFTTLNGEPVQVIAPRLHLDLPVIDLGGQRGSKRDVEVQRLISEEVVRPFDLSSGPLIRAQLLRLSDEEHVFLIVMHHIITDLYTLNRFVRELTILYDAYSTGKPSPLAKPPRQYADYVVWQQEWLKGKRYLSMLSYWRQQIEGQTGFLDLPTDRRRPAIQSLRGAEQPLQLSRSLTKALKQFSRQEVVSIFITMLSAYLVLLHRYTGQPDITVGVPFTNRRHAELKDVMGCFVNILPLAVDLSGNPSFREVIRQVRKAMLGAHQHQEVTVDLIVKELKLERKLGYNQLYQVGFTFIPPVELELQGLTVESLRAHNRSSKLDMFAGLWDSGERIQGMIEYSTDLFDEDTMARFAGHYLTLLKAVVTDADQPISLLPILTDHERKLVMVDWNSTRVDYPEDLCIHQLFEKQVEQTPDAVAVVFEDRQLTYRELNQRSNQLARYLQSIGVGPETLVGIAVERSMEMVVGLYGILKAGAAYVPVDPAYPTERISYMLEDAGIRLLLTQARFIDKLPRCGVHSICLDTDWDALIAGHSMENPVCKAGMENMAYTIYTSGSTGDPKGVMNTHRGILNRLLWMQETYQLTAADRVLQKTPFSFDVSVWEFFWPLMFGARLVIARPEGHKDNNYLVQLIIKQQITTIHFVPSMLKLFLNAEDVEKCNSLRRVICSGEALPLYLQNRFFEKLDSRLYNLYGPTEAAVDVTSWECRRESDLRTVPIGRPIANTRIYILDNHMQPVPIGVPGELYIGGVQVARGYLNRAELTAERFISDPFSDNPGDRLYKTGDICRYLPDGNIEYLGRNDDQVKIRGFRIELGEIESVLRQHPSVREAVVLLRGDVPDDRSLTAYVVSGRRSMPVIRDLRDFLGNRLPDYMVPAEFILLDAMPLTPSGKVDRRALSDLEGGRRTGEEYVAPENELEKTIAGIWQELLKVEKVGIRDNFFDLGGHSLLIVQVQSRLRGVVDRELSITDMFRYPTIEKLAGFLTQEQNEGPSLEKIHERARKQKEAFNRQRELVNKRIAHRG